MADYGTIHGTSASQYATKTFPKWKDGTTKLSGQTMERLVELVPPYLEPEQRYEILLKVLKKHKKIPPSCTIRVNIKEPADGFRQINDVLQSLESTDPLAYLPKHVMEAAKWLYDDDVTTARSLIAEATNIEIDILRNDAMRQINLLRRTIESGQVKSANYSVETPVGRVSVVAYSPSKCFVATVCFGNESAETQVLRKWRDNVLLEHHYGREFIVWYYTHGEKLAGFVQQHPALKSISKYLVGKLVKYAMRQGENHE
ncbi:hypothetical protein YA0002_25320 [Pseudomonas cichorii]|uniref:CFI-box-CTERM domain-containing protein n=1 Tax=Pseudomonas cichorii TaxID=36746 RepID=UPI0018E63FA2|nr:CFI-box-CTERM domain-containing protein [Pseudomonas cichorii]MBI6856087.1 hypothetical protein [Pseudomonas cichorii]